MAAMLAIAAVLAAAPVDGACMRVAKALPAGAVPIAADLAAAPCAGGPVTPGFRYDGATRTLRALRDLGEGETVAAVPPSLLAVVRPGQAVKVSARVGAVTVVRTLEAVRAARAGEPVLVRAADGKAFTAAAAQVQP